MCKCITWPFRSCSAEDFLYLNVHHLFYRRHIVHALVFISFFLSLCRASWVAKSLQMNAHLQVTHRNDVQPQNAGSRDMTCAKSKHSLVAIPFGFGFFRTDLIVRSHSPTLTRVLCASECGTSRDNRIDQFLPASLNNKKSRPNKRPKRSMFDSHNQNNIQYVVSASVGTAYTQHSCPYLIRWRLERSRWLMRMRRNASRHFGL